MAFHDECFVPSGTTITAAPTTNGAVAVSAAFASFLTRTSVSAESLLTVANGNPGNAINVYALSGLAIGLQQDLPVEPDARIPLGGGFFLVKPLCSTPLDDISSPHQQTRLLPPPRICETSRR